jgi:hypothetical protein
LIAESVELAMNQKTSPHIKDFGIIRRSFQTLFLVLAKRVSFWWLDYEKIPSNYTHLVSYTLDTFLNRAVVVGYLLYSSQITEKRKLLITLLAGMMAAIDDIVDTQNLNDIPEANLKEVILNHRIVGKQGEMMEVGKIHEFYDAVVAISDPAEFKLIEEFCTNALKVESKRLNSIKNREPFSLVAVKQYRNATTGNYSRMLGHLVGADPITVASIVNFILLYQILDDYMDLDSDLKLHDINFFLAAERTGKNYIDIIKQECKLLISKLSTPLAKIIVNFFTMLTLNFIGYILPIK